MGWFPRSPWIYLAALAHYRAGQYEQVIQKLSETPSKMGWPAQSIVDPIQAMAYYHLGQEDKAKAALASAEKAIDEWTGTMLKGSVGTMPIPWFDWIDCLLLYREAKILITGAPPPEDPRLQKIEDLARAALG
jgi:hypothetical protein